jgi:DNA modification methylase
LVGFGTPTPPVKIPRRSILLGDATERLLELPDNAIDCVVTSPPYYALRDYGAPGQIGLEATVDDWVKNLQAVFHEAARVLKPGGSLWLNLGDSFSRHAHYGAPPKGMLAAPERLLLALMGEGWIVRGKVIWSKPNGLPNSVADRLNLNYEVVYFLVREPNYFFDLDAIREPHRSRGAKRDNAGKAATPGWAGPLASGAQDGLHRARPADQPGHPLGKNPGSVWEIPTYGFRGQHFATFPPRLVRRPILATCPEAVCTRCGTPWKRQVTVERVPVGLASKSPRPRDKQVMRFNDRWHTVRRVGDLVPCGCQAPTVPGVVLDPFMGAGTVGLVAEELRRDWLGVEISAEYRQLAIRRIDGARRGS